MKDLLHLGIQDVLTGLHAKAFSVTELVKAYLTQIEKTKGLNAYVTVTPERALEDAKTSEELWAKGCPRPLEGVPLAIKDAFCTRHILTTASSKMLFNFIPSYESTVSSKVALSGTICLGKANLDEFCMGSTTNPVFTGASLNPWNPECTSGGSSGGSAVAVASGGALCALGTDTGGSVRQPAAFCGIVGVKPTYGRCSRWGVVAFASSLDTPGPLARSVKDAALLLEAMSGYDPKDATSLHVDVPSFSKAVGKSVRGMRVGVPKNWYESDQLDPQILALWEKGKQIFQEAGCEIVSVDLPYSGYSLPSYYILACAEAASNLQRYDGVKYGFRAPAETLEEMYTKTRGEGFGPEVKRRILIGTYVLSQGYYDAYYTKAQRVRKLIQMDFDHAFQHVDVLLTPTTPTPAFSLKSMPEDPVTMYWNDVLTVPVNIGNVTGISVPAGLSDTGLPLGLQIIAPALQEEKLFQFGAVVEQGAHMPSLPFGVYD
jgi:aspartyl-tRNA(Asn)/glutamyl-tRNA(Gln) amidotransferase subunit A